MELILVRHAEPVRIDSHETGGAPADPGLTGRGREQSERLAAWLAFDAIDALPMSPNDTPPSHGADQPRHAASSPRRQPNLIEYDTNADHCIPIEGMHANDDQRLGAISRR